MIMGSEQCIRSLPPKGLAVERVSSEMAWCAAKEQVRVTASETNKSRRLSAVNHFFLPKPHIYPTIQTSFFSTVVFIHFFRLFHHRRFKYLHPVAYTYLVCLHLTMCSQSEYATTSSAFAVGD